MDRWTASVLWKAAIYVLSVWCDSDGKSGDGVG
jgi:hypothetical protein